MPDHDHVTSRAPGGSTIPLSMLFGNPERTFPELSPDGTRLSYVAPLDGVLNIWVGALDGSGMRPVTNDRDRGVRVYMWAHDNEHLLYLQDVGGDENWQLHAVHVQSGEDRNLTPFAGVQAELVAASRHFPDTVLIGLNRDRPELHDLYRVTISTGAVEFVEQNPGVIAWLVDEQMRVRGGVQPRPDGGHAVLLAPDGGGAWQELVAFAGEDALTSAPLGFTRDGRGLYLISSVGVNAGRLLRWNLDDNSRDVLAEDAVYDVATVVVHPDTREVEAVAFRRERLEYTVLEAGFGEHLAVLRGVNSGELTISSRDDADRTWLVMFNADDGPLCYYAYDTVTRVATFLFDTRPALRDHTLARMEPFSFSARDGLQLHGYLSFPPGAPRRDLPTVINVHGGPWARDIWGFNAEAQWLANRGYLCVQVNFRGSTGYGKQFVNAGNRQWGARMHDDLLDAVDHVVGCGYADRDRVAIYGGSYGGYAALVGATFTPEAFCCAVDIVGPSNLKTLIETIPAYWTPLIAQFHERVGNPTTEEEFLWSRSPLSRVHEIRIPMLVVQGANDPRVKQAEAEQVVAAMRERGIAHEYMLFADEGHGFAKPENRLRFYEAAERFLDRHLARARSAAEVV